MAKPIRVGDKVMLPTGIAALVTRPADPARPWGAVHLGKNWHVVREQLAGGRVEHYFGGGRAPMQLSEADAIALAEALNRAQ